MSNHQWPFNLLQEHPMVHCRATIVLSPLSETCCMRRKGHAGACSPFLDPVVVVPPPPKAASASLTPFILKRS